MDKKSLLTGESNQRFSLRKLTIGVASVLVGTSFFVFGGQEIHADTTTDSNQNATVVEQNKANDQTTAASANKGVATNQASDEANQNVQNKQNVQKQNNTVVSGNQKTTVENTKATANDQTNNLAKTSSQKFDENNNLDGNLVGNYVQKGNAFEDSEDNDSQKLANFDESDDKDLQKLSAFNDANNNDHHFDFQKPAALEEAKSENLPTVDEDEINPASKEDQQNNYSNDSYNQDLQQDKDYQISDAFVLDSDQSNNSLHALRNAGQYNTSYSLLSAIPVVFNVLKTGWNVLNNLQNGWNTVSNVWNTVNKGLSNFNKGWNNFNQGWNNNNNQGGYNNNQGNSPFWNTVSNVQNGFTNLRNGWNNFTSGWNNFWGNILGWNKNQNTQGGNNNQGNNQGYNNNQGNNQGRNNNQGNSPFLTTLRNGWNHFTTGWNNFWGNILGWNKNQNTQPRNNQGWNNNKTQDNNQDWNNNTQVNNQGRNNNNNQGYNNNQGWNNNNRGNNQGWNNNQGNHNVNWTTNANPVPGYAAPEGHWPTNTASVYINTNDPQIRRVVLTAMNNWNNTGAFHFTQANNINNANIVVTPNWNAFTNYDGYTNTYFDRSTGNFEGQVQVRLNTYYLENPNMGYSFAHQVHTATHELGHAIGLEHNFTDNTSIMWPNSTEYPIQQKDVQEVNYIYQNLARRNYSNQSDYAFSA